MMIISILITFTVMFALMMICIRVADHEGWERGMGDAVKAFDTMVQVYDITMTPENLAKMEAEYAVEIAAIRAKRAPKWSQP